MRRAILRRQGSGKRITIDPTTRHGTPCIAGTRVPVSMIVGSLVEGDSPEVILKSYPQLEREDIRAAIHFTVENPSLVWGKRLVGKRPRLTDCIMCGSTSVQRKRVTVRRRSGMTVRVTADVCPKCGERYFDMEAMRKIEGG